jgi:hypothetical protein
MIAAPLIVVSRPHAEERRRRVSKQRPPILRDAHFVRSSG